MPVIPRPNPGDDPTPHTGDGGPRRTAAQLATDPAFTGAYVPLWKPNTAYTSGQFVLNPSGQIASANTSFTSAASYSASNWTVVSGGGSASAGLLSARPSATGSHALYTATDVNGGTTYQDTASGTWTQIGGGVAPSAFAPNTQYIDSTKFRKWRKALSRVRSGGADAKILCVGDSTTAGQSSSVAGTPDAAWPGVLNALLNSYYVPSALGACWGVSASGGGASVGFTDARQALGTGWSFGSAGGWSGGWNASSGAAGNLSITFAHSFDTIDVYYLKNTGHGTSTVNVDGGASLGNIVGSGTQSANKATFSCTAGTHTINVTGPSGGALFVLGIEAYSSTTRRVRCSNGGVGGTKTADWMFNDSGFQAKSTLLGLYQPDLAIVSLGINDAGASVSAATYTANLTTCVTALQAYADVLLMAPLPSSGSPYTTFGPQYVAALPALASSLGCGYLDFYGRWESYAVSNPLGYYSDGLHPTAFGYADLGQAVFNTLKTI